jgi:hypothetical protein
MYFSTYLNWFKRLLILGAVVAGLTASAAGAGLDSRPPDVRMALHFKHEDRIYGLARGDLSAVASTPSGPVTVVSRPPDVQDAATALHETPAGLKPDGVGPWGVSGTWEHRLHSPATASRYPTPAGLKADGLRWQGLARVDEQQQSDKAVRPDDRPGPLGVGEPTSVPVSGGSGFDWDDWAIGIGTGLGLALLIGGGIMVGRQQRHRIQPA